MPDRPHFAHPFQRSASGKVAVVEQDTEQHVIACENVIVRCPVGFRDDRPEFGWPWPEYRTDIRSDQLEVAMRRFEPRSRASATELQDLAKYALGERQIDAEIETNG